MTKTTLTLLAALMMPGIAAADEIPKDTTARSAFFLQQEHMIGLHDCGWLGDYVVLGTGTRPYVSGADDAMMWGRNARFDGKYYKFEFNNGSMRMNYDPEDGAAVIEYGDSSLVCWGGVD